MLKVYNFIVFQENQILLGSWMLKVLVNKTVKFQIKIPNGCWENSEKL